MGHTKREKRLFIRKVEYMCDQKFVSHSKNSKKRERDKLIRDILKRNTGKLIEDGGSIIYL